MNIISILQRGVSNRLNLYRVITTAGFILFTVVVLVIPARMSGASPWAYYYGVKNFSEGKFVLTDHEMFRDMLDAREQGGILMQYVKIGENRWALEKAPGYVLYLVPFKWLGIPRWGNILLAAGMVIVFYLLLKRLHNEMTACIGSLLILLTPIGLIMANRTYMDTFASLAFISIGGGLYFYYYLQKEKWAKTRGGILLFLAFFFIGWSVVTRQSNLLVAVVIAIHYVVVRIMAFAKDDRSWLISELVAVVIGIGLPAAALMLYNYFIFGSPLDYGYKYSMFPVKFAFEYLGQADASGASIPLNIIIENFNNVPAALFQGFPLLIIFIPALIFILYRKFTGETAGRWKGIKHALSWDILIVLIGWFLSVYGLYMTYEFTAEYLREGTSFFRYSRYYLPGLFPVALISALVFARLPQKLVIPIMFLIVAAGLVFYFQTALNINA